MLGIAEPVDWQAVDRECRRPGGRDPGQAGQNLPVGGGQERLDLVLKGVDVST